MKSRKDKILNIKKVKKQVKGITLIALVVTIIVLLILAGVALNLTIGQNGIFSRAQGAANTWKNAETNEQSALNDLSSWMEQYLNGGSQEDEQGQIKISLKIEGEKVTEPPVPSGFSHVDGTEINSGYVIQDGEGNQFVWVPVDKNQKIKINVTSATKIDNISLTDPYGDDIPLADTDNLGTTYDEEVNPTINGPYRLTVTAGGETKKVFLSVHSLYAIDTFNDWKATDEYAIARGYNNLEELLEDLGYATKEKYLMDGSGMKDYEETKDYKQSVNENGGFYIARYEASYEKGKAASKVSKNIRTSNFTKLEDGMLWNYIIYDDALSASTTMYTSDDFTSTLLTGAAWDRILCWLEETGAVSKNEIVGDSKNWGNYKDDTFTNTTELINTGVYSQTEKNNIYDLAGNLYEFTTEIISGYSIHVLRRWLRCQFWFYQTSF